MLFFFPLYYQFYKVPPTYPVGYANWVAIAWTVLGCCSRSGSCERGPRR